MSERKGRTLPTTFFNAFLKQLEQFPGLKLDVWKSAYEVIDRDGIFRLLKYRGVKKEKVRVPVLIVYAYINRPYILDLAPEVSVVKRFLEEGFETYMIDWGYPRFEDQYITLEDYVYYLDKSVKMILRENKVEKLSLLGYCLGGTLAVVYASLYPEKIMNLVIMAAPVDFHTENPIAKWARAINPEKLTDSLGNVPGSFLNITFLSVDPIRLIVGKYQGLLQKIEDEKFFEDFFRMERWIFDSPAIPREVFRQYISEWYRENKLIKNQFKIGNKKVNLRKINMPLLVLCAEYDHIVPPESSRALLEAVSSKDKKVLCIDRGHIGLSVSRKSHKELWPQALKWLKERSK